MASRDAVVLRDLVVRYEDFTAVRDLTLTVHYGEALGIIGPNGSGKSTLLKTIAGLLSPTSGELLVLGSPPRKLPPGSIAYVPQVEAVDWSFPATVWDVVAMGRFAHLHFWQPFGQRDREVVGRALAMVKMSELAGRHIAHLSGGQQQRAFVARAIAQEPKVLLLDEPTTGVDAATEEALRRIVRELVADGLPVLMATHDLDRVDDWFDRLLVIDRRVLALGTPREVVDSGAYAAHPRTHPHARPPAPRSRAARRPRRPSGNPAQMNLDILTMPFHYAFMQRAFVAALAVGLLCSTMGTYVILRKLSFIGDGIAHASFAGIVIAYLRGANFYIGAGIVAVLTAVGIGFVHRRGRISLDTTIGVLFTGMFALGVYLMSQQRSYAVDLQSFLFGDILAVQPQDLWLILALSIAVATTVVVLFRGLLYTTFDPVVAQASGISSPVYEYALLVMLALTIVVSLQAVGIVLVAALLVTPAAAAYQLTSRFAPMMALSAVFGAASTVGGLYLSYYVRASSGATIVLLATLLFFAAIGLKQLRRTILLRGA